MNLGNLEGIMGRISHNFTDLDSHKNKEEKTMCMNKKIRAEWNFSEKKHGGLVLDELNCGRPEVLNQMLTLIQERSVVPRPDRKSAVLIHEKWHAKRMAVEDEYRETNGN